MTFYFLDSSALAKLFVQEPGTSSLIELVESVQEPQLLVSSLGLVEVHSAIRRRERAGEISETAATDAIQLLASEFGRMTEQTINPSVIAAACQLLDHYALRALDAIQLASCIVSIATIGITDVVFVCADKVLISAASAEGLQVLNPEPGAED